MQGSRMLFGGIVTPAEGVGFAHAHLNPDKQVGSAPEIEPDASPRQHDASWVPPSLLHHREVEVRRGRLVAWPNFAYMHIGSEGRGSNCQT